MKVILAVVECLRRDHVHCYGYERETTPFLDSVVLSSRGMMWNRCRAIGDNTHATFRMFARFTRKLTLAGVPTVCFSANPIPAGAIKPVVKSFKAYGPSLRPGAWKHDDIAGQMVKRFVRTYRKAESLFAILHFVETHAPYSPGKHLDRFIRDKTYEAHHRKWGFFAEHGLNTIDKFGGLLPSGAGHARKWNARQSPRKGQRIATAVAYYIAAYDAAIRNVDGKLKPLFDAFPDAEIFVTGDHGEAMGERGFMHHAYGHFPELMRVPLIARTPHVPAVAYRSVDEKCNHRNMMKTICDRFGVRARGEPLPWLPMDGELDPDVRSRLEGLGYIGRDDDEGG